MSNAVIVMKEEMFHTASTVIRLWSIIARSTWSGTRLAYSLLCVAIVTQAAVFDTLCLGSHPGHEKSTRTVRFDDWVT